MSNATNSFIKLLLLSAVALSVAVKCLAQTASAQQPWLQLSNQLSISAEYYSVRGIDGRQLPLTYVFQGAPTIQIGDTPVPFAFVVSSFSNSYQTPFNQLGTSPKYKWIQVHAGYRNINFSNFTLGGQRMLGAGIELTPGKFQLGFFWGVIRKAIAPDTTNTELPPAGSFFFGPGYRRTGYGAKLGFGKQEKSNFTLSMFKGQDEVGSLDEKYRSLVHKPEANLVIGMAWKIRLSEHLSWVTDMALSAYTRNTEGDSIELNDVPFAGNLGNLFMPMVSSQYLTALETGLMYQHTKFKTYLKYRRIDPDFKSMGIYFINSDLEEYSINPSIRFNQKWSVNGSVGLQRDNLLDLKQRTTERFIYRAALDWNPKPYFALGLQHSNFGVSQNALAPNIADTTLLRQINTTYGINPRVTLRNDRVVQVIMLNATYQELSNAFSGAFAPPDVNTLQATGAYSWNLLKRSFSLTPSVTYVSVKNNQFETESIGGSMSVNSPLRFIPVNASVQAAVYANTVDGIASGNTWNASMQLNYRLKNGMSFQAGSQYLKNNSSANTTLPSFSEIRLKAGFAWSITKSVKQKNKA
jgi:hypothetical protein